MSMGLVPARKKAVAIVGIPVVAARQPLGAALPQVLRDHMCTDQHVEVVACMCGADKLRPEVCER